VTGSASLVRSLASLQFTPTIVGLHLTSSTALQNGPLSKPEDVCSLSLLEHSNTSGIIRNVVIYLSKNLITALNRNGNLTLDFIKLSLKITE